MKTHQNIGTNYFLCIMLMGVMLFAGGLSLNAQPAEESEIAEKIEKVESLRKAYIIKKAQLTEEEAEEFLPLYEQYREEIKNAFNSPDAENDHIKRLELKLAIEKKYHATFKQMLGEEKLNAVYNADKKFKWQLLKHLQNQKNEK